MQRKIIAITITMLLTLSLWAGSAYAGNVTLTLTVPAENSIGAAGVCDPNAWVSIKVLDSSQSIVFFEAVKADDTGNYDSVFGVPVGSVGQMEVVAGYGTNVAVRSFTVGASGELVIESEDIITPPVNPPNPPGGNDSSGDNNNSGGNNDSKPPAADPVGTTHPGGNTGVESPTINLSDVAGNWAAANINKLLATGAIGGYPDGTFKPANNITRAEFATVMVKAFKLEQRQEMAFSDVSGHWAKEYIATAQAHKIVSGYSDGRFGPNDLITREQMAVMIVNASKLVKASNTVVFIDQDQISAWAADAVAIASSQGIMSGYPDQSFKPGNNANRAEAVTVIAKALSL